MSAEKSQEQLSDDENIILLTLVKLGGKGERYRILNEIGKGDIKVLLPANYLEELKSGNRTRYEANVSWASDRLKKKGYLRRDSPRGLWEITDEGRKKLKDWLEMILQK
ncbi:MAG: winged helix-turn-helix domain-containing protein [Candidatus Omnitrophica bacterium]|nr:winged helix-turn-helix domain-containing protein [Candidatus Omnitrophota bacterium]